MLGRVRNAQLDDQTPGSAHPVVLLPLDSASRADAPGTHPLLYLTYVCEPGQRRGCIYCPCIAARILPLRVSVREGGGGRGGGCVCRGAIYCPCITAGNLLMLMCYIGEESQVYFGREGRCVSEALSCMQGGGRCV